MNGGWLRARAGGRYAFISTVSIWSMLAIATAIGDEDRDAFSLALFASPADSSVRDWIWYQILGNSNHPFPIVYISTSHFETARNEFLIVLPQPKYGAIAQATQTEILSPSCAASDRSHDLPTEWYTVEVAKHHSKQTQKCRVGRGDACAFLRKISTLPNVGWTAAERKPMDLITSDVCCTEVGDGWTAPPMCEQVRSRWKGP